VDKQNKKAISEISFDGSLPDKPADLYRLHRLCLRMFGLMTRDVSAQANSLAEAASSSLSKKERKKLAQLLVEELPVFIALYALEHLSSMSEFSEDGPAELIRSLLLPCFSMSYVDLYEQHQDPLKHVLARVDWYLDGDKGEPLSAFIDYVSTLTGEKMADGEPLANYIKENLQPEMDKRLELAVRYEFALDS
jgi:hypothetical protein